MIIILLISDTLVKKTPIQPEYVINNYKYDKYNIIEPIYIFDLYKVTFQYITEIVLSI